MHRTQHEPQGDQGSDVLNTVTFEDQRGKTALTLQARVIQATAVAPQYLKGMEVGWSDFSLFKNGLHRLRENSFIDWPDFLD